MDGCPFDTAIHGGMVVTASDSFPADVGIRDGRIDAVAERTDGGATRIDAGTRRIPARRRSGHRVPDRPQWTARPRHAARRGRGGSGSAP